MASKGSAPQRPASGSRATSSRRAPTPEPTPSEPGELRRSIAGREHEFVGIGFIVVGVLLALAMYLGVAGPVGDAVDDGLAWVMGLGRYVAPIALAGIGAALIHRGKAESRTRLLAGWAIVVVAILGLLHVAYGPDSLTGDLDDFGDAGGWLGALLGQPLQALIGTAGAVVVLLAILIGGVLILTQMSLRDMIVAIVGAVAGASRWTAKQARTSFGSITTLSGDRGTGDADSADDPWSATPAPSIYDVEQDPDALPSGDEAAPRPRQRKKATLPAPDGPVEQPELDLGPAAQPGTWTLPPATALERTGAQTIDRAEVEARGRTLQESLASHGVDTKLVGMTVGPTVTRFELELGAGVKVARVTALQKDIAYAMAATDVRILAPIPGRSAIGVEVPNHTRQLVSLGDLLTSPEARAATHPLDVAIGKDIAGRSVFLNLATTPHMLIAGATGAGKSSGINCIITSLLMRTTPDQVRLILIDPKQVEMGQYNKLPHLLTQPVTNPKKAANALAWAVKEMERRYDLLFEMGFRDISGYNSAFDRGELQLEPGSERVFERLPYIVVVVDELNDLMMVAARDVEESITRIAQKARAVGIHLIVATQRPSVNVITGVIKANVPARMAFAVSSLTDSRVILDQPGAEKLIGKGDMLLLPGNSNVAQRIQGSFVSEEEVRVVTAHWRRQAPELHYVSGVEGDDDQSGSGGSFSSSGSGSGSSGDDDDETLLRQAMELVVRSQLGSTSMLQRKLKVGFARAGRIMDLLEERGVVGPSEGSKARQVLMTVEELEARGGS
jgi:DNA segregation ATPase FtsK/SpoIIIE, S-DNA-T family